MPSIEPKQDLLHGKHYVQPLSSRTFPLSLQKIIVDDKEDSIDKDCKGREETVFQCSQTWEIRYAHWGMGRASFTVIQINTFHFRVVAYPFVRTEDNSVIH